MQIELDAWEDRYALGEEGKGNAILDAINTKLAKVPGISAEISEQAQGPAQGKPVHLRLKGTDWADLLATTERVRGFFDAQKTLADIEDTRPLPGIDWQIDVDVEKAGRFGSDVASVGAMVQLVTRGVTLDTMRVDSSDEEIDIRVRFPEEDRLLSTLDTLRVRTPDGLVPLANFVSRKPVPKLGQIDRVDASRFFDVKANIAPGISSLVTFVDEADGTRTKTREAVLISADTPQAEGPEITYNGTAYRLFEALDGNSASDIQALIDADEASLEAVTPSERIELVTAWLTEQANLPETISYEWTGDQEEQEESGQFLMTAFAGALGLMFVILLMQFNSFYNSVLVLTAVVMSVSGALIGMLVMGQPFSIIMTGTGIVALAGIVVNNNIVLIDTYQDYARTMPKIEAIIRTAEDRIRPVLLTTITTMAGLAPMMLGISVDFLGGGFTIDAPTSLWWKQLATAVVFGLGIATFLTLIFTPSMLALRVWVTEGAFSLGRISIATLNPFSQTARDRRLRRQARKTGAGDVTWSQPLLLEHMVPGTAQSPRAAE